MVLHYSSFMQKKKKKKNRPPHEKLVGAKRIDSEQMKWRAQKKKSTLGKRERTRGTHPPPHTARVNGLLRTFGCDNDVVIPFFILIFLFLLFI